MGILLPMGKDAKIARNDLLRNTWQAAHRDPLKAYTRLALQARQMAGPKSLADPLCAATEWIVWALRHGDLSPAQVVILAENRVDHAQAYQMCANVDPYFITTSEPSTNEERIALLESLPFQNGRLFLVRLRQLVDVLTPEGRRTARGRKRGATLEGLSEAHLRGTASTSMFGTHGVPAGQEPSTHGSKVYEAELFIYGPFRAELDECLRAVGLDRWEYDSEKGLNTFGRHLPAPRNRPKDDPVTQPFGGYPQWLLHHLCQTWCLQSVSTQCGSTELENGIWITAKRLDVIPFDYGTAVFIPRYYSYSDIEYRDGGETKQGPKPDDFARVKQAIERFGHVRLQQSRASRVKQAKLWRTEFKRRGLTMRAAWEQARQRSELSREDMTKECGEQPRK